MTTYTADDVTEMVKKCQYYDGSEAFTAGYLASRTARVMNIVSDETKTDAEKLDLLKIILLP
jgi:hypothetical protein